MTLHGTTTPQVGYDCATVKRHSPFRRRPPKLPRHRAPHRARRPATQSKAVAVALPSDDDSGGDDPDPEPPECIVSQWVPPERGRA